jgi:hypothetical protein
MDGQLLFTLLCIVAAGLYLAGSTVLRLTRRGSGCGAGCGGCKKPTEPSVGLQMDITGKLRARTR